MQLKVAKCLADVGLSGESKTLSKKLSGGQKRKLSLALALIGNPRVSIETLFFNPFSPTVFLIVAKRSVPMHSAPY